MPIRIQPSRPYYPRYYLPRPRQQTPAVGRGGGGAKGAFGGGVDTSPTGNVGGDIVKAINNVIQQNRQNAAANQILNTQTPPRAAWAGGTAPAAGVSTAGTPPQTGGMGELQLRQQQNQADLADQLQRAKIAAQLALVGKRAAQLALPGQRAGSASRWQQYLGGDQDSTNVPLGTKRGGKPAPYEPGSIDPNTDPNADKFPVVQADFDAQYGKGMYAKVMSRLGNTQPDDKGNYVVTDANDKPIISLPPTDANFWLSRVNAARVRAGQQPVLSDKFPSANPNSGQAAGTEVNPYKPQNQLEARSLPYNSYFIDPQSGQVGQKLPEEKQQPPAAQKTSQADTGDQGQLAQQPPDTSGGFSLASGMGSPVPSPAPTDMSIGVGLDRTGGVVPDVGAGALADAIQRARAQDQLQGIA